MERRLARTHRNGGVSRLRRRSPRMLHPRSPRRHERGNPGTMTSNQKVRREVGSDRRRTAQPITAPPISYRRIAFGRLAVIVTTIGWLAYFGSWLAGNFFNGQPLNTGRKAEAIVYLILVTLLTASSLAFLISRLGFFYRATAHHRTPRAIDRRVLRQLDADADRPRARLSGGRRGHPQHPALGGSPGVPLQAGRAPDRRPPDAEHKAPEGDARRRAGAAPPDRGAAGRAGRAVLDGASSASSSPSEQADDTDA